MSINYSYIFKQSKKTKKTEGKYKNHIELFFSP